MRIKYNNNLIDNYLIIAIVTPMIFGITFPIATKLKGVLFSAAVISFTFFIQRLIGLLQPIIYKYKITTNILIKFIINLDIIWSINIFSYIYFKNDLVFLIIHILINMFLDVLYTAMTFKIEKRIGEIVDFEEFRVTEHTLSTISSIITLGIVSILLVTETNIPYLLFISGVTNILLQITNYKILKEFKC